MSAGQTEARPARADRRLEILPGTFLDDITTLARCEEVMGELMTSIPDIESQIEFAKKGLSDARTKDPTWLPRATKALRSRKLAMPMIQQLRARLAREAKHATHDQAMQKDRETRNTADRACVKILWEIAPEMAARVKRIAEERHPDLFNAVDLAP